MASTSGVPGCEESQSESEPVLAARPLSMDGICSKENAIVYKNVADYLEREKQSQAKTP